MNNDYYNSFLDSSEKVIESSAGPARFKLGEGGEVKFNDAESVISRFRASLRNTIENLDDELTRFENNFANKHNAIFWASDYNDVFEGLKRLIKSQKAKSVRLPNVNSSTIFRELGIKYFLRDEKIELAEDGDMQFFNADMLLSDTGSILLLNQTNNSLARLTNHKTNVFFTTIDRVLGNSDWVEVFQQLVSYKSDCGKQDMIIFKGSANCNNYLFIIDNQRSQLLHNKEIRQSLCCLQCGRCNDVCPVFQTIGEEPYNNVFSGPIANVMLPYLETMESYRHVLYACTMCGRCEEVCPIGLPIRDMIVAARHSLIEEDGLEKSERRMLAVMRKMLTSRSKMNASSFIKRYLIGKFISSEYHKSHRLTPFSKETFNKSYKKFIENEQ
ncbi:MAG: lactate utilization protein [Bacteroidales bacterium]|nr:lactate utilization protein [Bacteroidales bacterium]